MSILKLIKSLIAVLLGWVWMACVPVQAQPVDGYGGSLEISIPYGDGAGFFRTEFHRRNWWLVTPDNHVFLTYGLNHFHSGLWAAPWNKEAWEEEFGATAYSDTWRDEFFNYAMSISKEIGANTLGYHNEDRILQDQPRTMPYIRQFTPLNLSLHLRPAASDFVDVFDPKFEKTCAKAAQEQVLPYVNDPMIIGFAMSDVPVFTQRHAQSISAYFHDYSSPTWSSVLRNKSGDASGKLQYVATMKEVYQEDISQFNDTYDTSYSSWEQLVVAENWREEVDYANTREIADNNAFAKLCIRKYYEVAAQAFRSEDQNHLFFGDKISANLKDPEELKLVIGAVKDYVDVLMIQCFAKPDYQQTVYESIVAEANLPIINGDGGFGAQDDPRMPTPQRPTAQDQTQRAEWLVAYVQQAFANPNFVGYHLCGVIDSWKPEGVQKPGIVNPLGIRHEPVFDALRTIGSNLYQYKLASTAIDD